MQQQYFKHFQLAAFSPYGVFIFKWFFVCATQKKCLVGMYNINEKNSNIKAMGKTSPENLNGKL